MEQLLAVKFECTDTPQVSIARCTGVTYRQVLYLYCIYHCQNWLQGPHSGGEPAGGNKIGGPVGSRDTSLISTAAWPLSAVGYSSL